MVGVVGGPESTHGEDAAAGDVDSGVHAEGGDAVGVEARARAGAVRWRAGWCPGACVSVF
jgi:hypothetical protein